MENNSATTFELVKENIMYGDYNLLNEILQAKTVTAARARFLRGDEEAISAMIAIQKNRKEFVEKYKNSKNKTA